MTILRTIYSSFQSRHSTIMSIVSIFATLGTVTVLLGGVWDSASHALRIPENFWTIQHITIYTGAALVASSAAVGFLVSLQNKKISKGILILLVGSAMQLGGGFADYNFHEIYGIDGLVTPSHLTVECGLLLSAVGGFVAISKSNYAYTKRIIPLSIMTVLLSASWIIFNLTLLLGAVALCVPVFELFSSGCAVM